MDVHAGWTPTRDEALRRLADFVPHAGASYAKSRNFDLGPDGRSNVSMLSPYIRHRLIGEDEVARAVLRKYPIGTAGKFIEQVCWRTYWKGWLEQRPSVWTDFLAERDRDRALCNGDPAIRERLARAEAGETGIACFDAWAQELVTTGYLHNHTRMWFASIWILTLQLPWPLGADFFYRHLVDGDPASNTLSWRWVAGLHTPGKHYLARASNIAEFTNDRFNPVGSLNEVAVPPVAQPHPEPVRLRPVMSVAPAACVVLLLHEDDLSPERWPVPREAVRAVAAMPVDRSYDCISETVLSFRTGAVADALTRAGREFECPTLAIGSNPVADMQALCAANKAEMIATIGVPVGPARLTFDTLLDSFSGSGLSILELRRSWDAAFWPHARRGFFQLKERIPEILEKLELM